MPLAKAPQKPAPHFETPMPLARPSAPSVLDRACSSQTKGSLLETREFQRVTDKQAAEKLSAPELCQFLRSHAGSTGPIAVNMHRVSQEYVVPEPARPFPVDTIIKQISDQGIMCANTGKPMDRFKVILIGPYANGPHGICGTRDELTQSANSNVQQGPEGQMLTNLGDEIGYWFTLEDAETFSDEAYQVYGVREDRMLSDGHILAKVQPLLDAKALSEFIVDKTKLLNPPSPEKPTNPAAPEGHGSVLYADQPFIENPLGNEGKVCVNNISLMLNEWKDEESTDRVAIYPRDQPVSNGSLKAYCYTREELSLAFQNAVWTVWVGDQASPARVYRLPYPQFFVDAEAFEDLSNREYHSYVLLPSETASVGDNWTMKMQNQQIYTVEPMRDKADVQLYFGPRVSVEWKDEDGSHKSSYNREGLSDSLQDEAWTVWVGGRASPARVYRLPYPRVFVDAAGFEALSNREYWSYVLVPSKTASVGDNWTMKMQNQQIYTMEPMYGKADA